MAPLLTFLATFGLVAAMPLLLVWSVIKLTKREQFNGGSPQPGRVTPWRVGLICFLIYILLFIGLGVQSIGGHMAHADLHGARSVSFDPSLVAVDRMLSAMGTPIPSLAEILANYLSIRLSPLSLLPMYVANGVFLSLLVAYAYGWLTRKKNRHVTNSTA